MKSEKLVTSSFGHVAGFHQKVARFASQVTGEVEKGSMAFIRERNCEGWISKSGEKKRKGRSESGKSAMGGG